MSLCLRILASTQTTDIMMMVLMMLLKIPITNHTMNS